MSLLGTPLLILLGALAVLFPVATLLLWSRIRGPRAVRGASRLGLLGAGQIATVLLVMVLANNYGQFYTSWGDLLGSSGGKTVTANYGAKAVAGAPTTSRSGARSLPQASLSNVSGHVTVTGTSNWSSPQEWKTKGKVLSVRITGSHSGLSVPGYVYLPPQYFSPRFANHRFPAVEVLTGYPGSALNLVSRMNYPGEALKLVQAHRSHPMIYVMISSTVAPPRDTECTNVPGGPQAETFMGSELPSAIAHGFRAMPNHWGVIGDSTGGYCAAKLTMQHPEVFSAGVSLSGYYHALNGGTAGNLFHGSKQVEHQNNLAWLLAHRPAPKTNLMVTIGKDETIPGQGYQATMRFLHLVKAPMHVTAMIEQNGGHNFRTWDRELPTALSWLSHQMNHHHWSIGLHAKTPVHEAAPTVHQPKAADVKGYTA